MRIYQVIARLADGVTIPQARSELATITARLARDYPQTNQGIEPTIVTYNERATPNQIRLVFWSLMGAVGFVLLIACSNVANLLLARSAERAKEVGVRVSLGASRGRVIRQLLVESVMLSLLGGIVGIPLAYAGIRIFDSLTQNVGKPYWMEFSIDPVVLLFFFAICFVTGVVFGLAPALHVSKTSLNEVLKEGGRSGSSGIRAHRWTNGLLVVQVALTLVLLAGAGFMMRSFFVLYRLDLGFETPRLLTLQVNLNDRKYPTAEERNSFARRLTESLKGNRSARSGDDGEQLPSQRRIGPRAHDRWSHGSEHAAAGRHDGERGGAVLRHRRDSNPARPRLHCRRRDSRAGRRDREPAVRRDVFQGRGSARPPDQPEGGQHRTASISGRRPSSASLPPYGSARSRTPNQMPSSTCPTSPARTWDARSP